MNAVMKIAKFAYENDRTFTLNLSALFLTQYYKKEFIAILPYVDILFGNDDVLFLMLNIFYFILYIFNNLKEALSFAKNVLNIQATKLDIKKIAKIISGLRKLNNKKKRLVIITRADKPVIYCDGIKVNEIEVPTIHEIIDTSCAGDAFVGGFLAQYVKYENGSTVANIEKCIDCGIWTSGLIIQRNGCDIPDIDFSELYNEKAIKISSVNESIMNYM